MFYFDYAASSILYPEVLDTLLKSFREDFANPSSKHILGHDLFESIEDIRLSFLKNLNIHKQFLFYFTSSATESNNTAIFGTTFKKGDVIIYSPADHPSITSPIEFLANKLQLTLKPLQLNESGEIDSNYLLDLLNEDVKLIALTHVNNQSGVIQDIATISKKVKEKSHAHIHIDAVQSFGKISLTYLNSVDSISISAHKIGGPKGIAGLYLKKDHNISPFIFGGNQENGFRSSTQAYPLILGFQKAMYRSFEDMEFNLKRISQYSKQVNDNFIQEIPDIKLPFQQSSPYIFSFIIPKFSSDIFLRHLEIKRIFISSSSACSSKISGYSPTLAALHIPEKNHKSFIRISFGAQTTQEEVNFLMKEFVLIWKQLSKLSKG